MLRKFMIERDVPGIGMKSPAELGKAAMQSNKALAKLEGIQWIHSYASENKTFCVYLATNAEMIREHARLSGFPANKITEVMAVFEPWTEMQSMPGQIKSTAA